MALEGPLACAEMGPVHSLLLCFKAPLIQIDSMLRLTSVSLASGVRDEEKLDRIWRWLYS